MNLTGKTGEFVHEVQNSLTADTFVKISLGNYKGKEENLKNIFIKRVTIKGDEKLSFTYRYKTRDIVKNYSFEEGIRIVQDFLNQEFYVATLFTTAFNLGFENFHDKRIILRKNAPTVLSVPSSNHDRSKNRLITTNEKAYLAELRITDESGKVLANSQDKYKQINRYIEILSQLIKEIPARETLRVVDMGSGKGYLTFALYDYLTHVVRLNTKVTGVEFRPELVDLCNTIAKNSGFSNLGFEQGTIAKHANSDIDILIALHACDTATDEAIFKGITSQADLIVVAPCCHKQIRRQIEAAKKVNELDFLTRYGIFLERQAEMVTDGLRAMILEYYGYKTKVFEFISDAHTPKNVMITAIRNQEIKIKDDTILQKIKESKAYFGIEYHHLEKLMDIV